MVLTRLLSEWTKSVPFCSHRRCWMLTERLKDEPWALFSLFFLCSCVFLVSEFWVEKSGVVEKNRKCVEFFLSFRLHTQTHSHTILYVGSETKSFPFGFFYMGHLIPADLVGFPLCLIPFMLLIWWDSLFPAQGNLLSRNVRTNVT